MRFHHLMLSHVGYLKEQMILAAHAHHACLAGDQDGATTPVGASNADEKDANTDRVQREGNVVLSDDDGQDPLAAAEIHIRDPIPDCGCGF